VHKKSLFITALTALESKPECNNDAIASPAPAITQKIFQGGASLTAVSGSTHSIVKMNIFE